MKKPIIGLCGPAGSGKDSVADILVKYYGRVKYSFADPLKAGCAAAFGLTEAQLYGDEKELPVDYLGDKTPRQILQWFGTDFARDMIDSDVWVETAKRNVLARPHYDWVIADCRFQNEVDMIQSLGGVVIGIQGRRAEGVPDHASEKTPNYSRLDYVLFNNGDLGKLRQNTDQMMKHWKKMWAEA